MPAIVILGLKLPFRALWEKTGVQERPMCGCPTSAKEFVYCPHCGTRKATRQIKMYKSRLTGEETTYRHIHSVLPYLHHHQLDLYDTNPRGYTDDSVYIYFTQPNCYLEVNNTDPVNMHAIQQYPYELEDWMRELLGPQIWSAGQFGLWAFTKEEPETPAKAEAAEEEDEPTEPRGGETRTFIIPIGPRFNE